MPLTVLQYKCGRGLEEIAEKLAKELPGIVSEALHVENGVADHTVPGDVEVWVQESGKLDVNTGDLEIIIWANECPERLKNLHERRNEILRRVRALLADFDRNVSGYVWILLQRASFGTI